MRSVPSRFTFYAVALFACFTLIGCSTRYVNALHPEYGQTAYDRDWYECQRENTSNATYVNRYFGSSGAEVDYNMAQSCMRARGWQPGNASPPQPSSIQPASIAPPVATPKPKSHFQLHFCDLEMEWDEVLGQCWKAR